MESASIVAHHYRRNAGFVERTAIKGLRVLFPVLERVAPRWAQALTLKIYVTPPRSRTPARERVYRDRAAIDTVVVDGQALTCYSWGESERKVLLCHAWGGRATQMGAFVEPLVQQGFQVVAFDAPAHGLSQGCTLDLSSYANAVRAIQCAKGPFRAIVGHSYGAGSGALALAQPGNPVSRLVLIGCFAHGKWLTDRFGAILNLRPRLMHRLRESVVSRDGQPIDWSDLDVAKAIRSAGIPVLVVHDRDDVEIPYENAITLSQRDPARIRLVTTQGLGHRRIVRDRRVIDMVCNFIATEAYKP